MWVRLYVIVTNALFAGGCECLSLMGKHKKNSQIRVFAGSEAPGAVSRFPVTEH